jgi:hypothetical protein
MDYLFTALIDPIEIDEHESIVKIDPFPDTYRQYLFCQEYPIKCSKSPKIMAQITHTKKKYWHDKYDCVNKMMLMIDHYEKLPEHVLTKYLDDVTSLPDSLRKFYDKIYNMADIIITKAKINDDHKLLISVIGLLFKKINKSIHIIYRIIFYLATYLIKNHAFIKKTGLISTIISKLEEFLSESNIWKYFTLTELDNYLCYIKKNSNNDNIE